MHTFKTFVPALALSAALLTVACGDDEGSTTDATATDPTTTTAPSTSGTTEDTPTTSVTATEPTTTTLTTTSPSTTSPATSEPMTSTTDDTTTTGDDPFVFDETPAGELVQLDRMGMPAVATAVISSDMKDAYNEATPEDDATQQFVDDIVANVTALHDALDDDLMGLGLVPCAVADCAMQAAPLVVPDVLRIDASKTAGFPNGRRLADPVIDVTLAVILLDLMEPGQDAGTFAGVPVNPPENDKAFLDDFPYIADPH